MYLKEELPITVFYGCLIYMSNSAVTMVLFVFSRDMDDNTSLEDMPFERTYPERGSMTSVNSNATTCTTDSSSSGGSTGMGYSGTVGHTTTLTCDIGHILHKECPPTLLLPNNSVLIREASFGKNLCPDTSRYK